MITIQITSREAHFTDVATTPFTEEVFRILGFTQEACDDLRDLQLACTKHSDTSTQYEANWRVAKDAGWVAASWTVRRDNTTSVEVTYQLSEDEMEDMFGDGDYSCTSHAEPVLDWEGTTTTSVGKLNPEMPMLAQILEKL